MYTEEQFQDKLQELKAIGEEMQVQDNRHTENPLFVIQEDSRVYGVDDAEFKERDNDYEGDLCEACDALCDEGKSLEDDCEECPDEAFNWYKIEKVFNLSPGVFFTAKACQEHIDSNEYHYTNPRSFAVGTYRNPEMKAVINFLKNIPDGK